MDGRPNRVNKAVFSNISGVVWTEGLTVYSQCRKRIGGFWSLITVHVIDQHLSRPISGPNSNTIMRKGRLEVVLFDSVFWGGKHSGKISPKSLCTYLHCDYLTYSISNNTHTHTLLVVSTTSCYRAQNNDQPAVPSKLRKWPTKLRTLRLCWPANFLKNT